MKFIFDKYIDNPSGTASVITNRNMYKQMYQQKFDTVLMRENGNIKFELYVGNDNVDSHYIYLKIPSEVVPNFYYDVVIQLYTTDNKQKNNMSLRSYFVKFYSNDPAFVYTFAHSFIKNKLFIQDLEPKMSKEAIKNVARIKNPKDEVWYVKSLYFAYLAMEKYSLFNRVKFNVNTQKYDKKKLLNKIMQAESKIALRKSEEAKIKEEKQKEVINKNKQHKNTGTLLNNNMKISTVSKVTKTSKVSNTTKRAKLSKKG